MGTNPIDVIAVSPEINTKSGFKINKRFLSLLAVGIVIIFIAINLILYLRNYQKYTVPKTDRGYPLHQSVEQAFTKSDKYYYLIGEIDRAILEKDPTKKYQNLVSLFQKMNAAYQDTVDAKTLAILYQLKAYASAVKLYKDKDFVIRVKK